MLVEYSVITTGKVTTIPSPIDWEKVNEMKDLKTMAPVTLLLLLVIAAMGVMVFWGLSLLDLSE
ncbi:MAG: hypothetical protein ACXW39_07650 [Nitrospira sp.]